MANLQSTSVQNLTTATDINNSARGFQVFRHTHSSDNPQTTDIVRTGNGWYQWSYGMNGATGGWPSCPTSFHYFCPIQRQNTSARGTAFIDVHGTHRGMGGYLQLYRIKFRAGSDAAHISINCVCNGSNRWRFVQLDQNFNMTEHGGFSSNTTQVYSMAFNTVYYKYPLLFKIYTLCGADEAWNVTVTSNSTALFPPYKGRPQVAGNVTPTSGYFYT